ncbi:MAG: DUF2092 domain-containing protein [Flavipsychrobacter sp.]|nr:DUF2092 domain-containing protein [Flavipsychrobacter sp.]
MKKSTLFLLFICILSVQVKAQSRNIDTVAVSLLDRMSAMIGDLKSCSATVKSCYDVATPDLGLVKHSDVEHVYVGGSDKLLIRSEGDKGNRYMSYNGQTLSYYSVDKNHYARTKVPGSVVEMIDYMNKNYGIVFPMADFLYPTFVDDILADATNLSMLGMTKVDGKECFHIAGTSKDKTFQFWIANDAFYLPVKLVIIYTNKPMTPQYEAVYSDWEINPVLPNSIFDFKAPANAKKIKLTPLSAKN